MKLSKELLSEISKITLEIEQNYPELYNYLDENPITIPNKVNSDMDEKSLKDYLETLKSILKKYKEEHSKNP